MVADSKKKPPVAKKSASVKSHAPKVRKTVGKAEEVHVEVVPTVAVNASHQTESVAPERGKYSFAVGRRKTSVARVRLYHQGKGDIVVNGKDYRTYFPVKTWQDEVLSPMTISGTNDKMDASVVVLGGGVHSQAGAVRHGIARALLDFNETYRKTLKKVGYLTRDPRAKERKKPGLRRARRAPQWAKR